MARALDRVRVRDIESPAGGDPQLVGDQVASGDHLGDRVLDLQPRVHLEEGRPAMRIEQELAGPRADVADGATEREGGLAEPVTQRRIDRRRRRLLEDLLVAALDRAVALAEVDARAMAIEQHLDLDVARADHQALEDQPVVIEGGCRLAPGRGDGVGQCLGATDRAHALAAAPCRGLDQQGKADLRRRRDERVVGRVGFVVAGEDRDPERGREPAGRGLVAHDADRLGRRADPADPGRDDGLGEVRVLGEEPEARGGARPRLPPVAASTTAATSSRSSAPGPSVAGTTDRIPSRSQVRVMRVAISPRLAMNSVRIGLIGAAASGVEALAPATNASIASLATRQRPPTRRAGSRPLAIQRWTDRVVAPTRAAAWLGLSSSDIDVAIVAYHAQHGVAAPGSPADAARILLDPASRPACASR